MTRSQGKPSRTRLPTCYPILKLPPHSPDQLEGLRATIAVNGVLVPILVDSDGPRRGIIDGNFRKDIADDFGYNCPEIVMAGLDDQEKRTLARALNLAHRQRDREQKRQLIADQLREAPDRTNRWVGKMISGGDTRPKRLRHREADQREWWVAYELKRFQS